MNKIDPSILKKARDEVIRQTVALQRTAPFYSYIVMHMNTSATVSEDLPTAAVNAKGDLFYNPEWFISLKKSEQIFVLAHEASHMSLLTHVRLGNRDMQLWNVATDLIINHMLRQDGYDIIKDCLVPDIDGKFTIKTEKKNHIIQVEGRIAEQIYDDLNKVRDEIKEELGLCDDCGGRQGSYKGAIDGHIYNTGDGDEKSSSIDDATTNEIATKWRRIIANADVASKQAGKTNAFQERYLDRIVKPEVDWKTVLQRFVTSRLPADISMIRPGRRSMALGYYTPTVIKNHVHVVVAPDVSGSISESEYNAFMGEVRGILHSSNQIHMTIIPWAHTVLDEDVLDMPVGTRKDISEYKIKNSGGTSLNCLTEYMEEHNINPEVCVILTDGYIYESKPKVPKCPTLAVISKGGTAQTIKGYVSQITTLNNEGI